jgi:hypothetical protein
LLHLNYVYAAGISHLDEYPGSVDTWHMSIHFYIYGAALLALVDYVVKI